MTDRLNNNIRVKKNNYVYVFLYIKYYGIVSVWKRHEDGQFTYFVQYRIKMKCLKAIDML